MSYAYYKKRRAYELKRYGKSRVAKSTIRRAKRSRGRKRSYGKKRAMSKRTVLNTTSRKKREVMLSYSNTTNTGASQTVARATAYVAGNATGFFVYSPTCRDLLLGGGHTVIQESMRTASTCYQRGFSEHLRVQTSSGIPWFHRRICFTTKGINAFNAVSTADTSPTQTYGAYVATSNGMERLWFNQVINAQPSTYAAAKALLFKGAENQDWDDVILAPVDTSRVTLKFDKTWMLRSGNSNGTIVERKLWHPMNKNLVFDDDQSGQTELSSYFSTEAKAGMGDYYIVDIFQAGVGATSSDLLNVYSNSTMYWHEK